MSDCRSTSCQAKCIVKPIRCLSDLCFMSLLLLLKVLINGILETATHSYRGWSARETPRLSRRSSGWSVKSSSAEIICLAFNYTQGKNKSQQRTKMKWQSARVQTMIRASGTADQTMIRARSGEGDWGVGDARLATLIHPVFRPAS